MNEIWAYSTPYHSNAIVETPIHKDQKWLNLAKFICHHIKVEDEGQSHSIELLAKDPFLVKFNDKCMRKTEKELVGRLSEVFKHKKEILNEGNETQRRKQLKFGIKRYA